MKRRIIGYGIIGLILWIGLGIIFNSLESYLINNQFVGWAFSDGIKVGGLRLLLIGIILYLAKDELKSFL